MFAFTMNKTKKPEITSEKIGLNPFLGKLEIPVNRVTYEKQYEKDVDGHWLPVQKELEASRHCKIYVSKENRLNMMKLSARAIDLFLWIVYESENSCEWIWVNKKRYMEERGVVSINTYKGALVELIKAGYLISSVIKDVYWINPDYFFNGNRVSVFPKNVVRK